jgi:DeoR family glycerol-3-phosphate regulon repressor
VTNNIHVANILSENPDTDILLAGGLLRRSDGGLVGEVTADFVRQFKVDVAVLGASAIDQAGDALDFDFREVRVAQAVMSRARRSILVADRSKLARTAPVAIAPVGSFDLWITDAAPPAELTRRVEAGKCEILVAPLPQK